MSITGASITATAVRDEPSLPPGRPAVPAPRHARVATWLAVALCCLAPVASGSHTHLRYTADALYYYAVAKHIATDHSFNEPLLWNFLLRPEAVVHHPFDYWSPATSLALIVPFFLFDPSLELATLVMAALSSLGVWLFWLVSRRLLGRPLLCAAATLVFAGLPLLTPFRLTTESIIPFQIGLLLAMLLLLRGDYAWAVAASFLCLLARSEGGFTFVATAVIAAIGAFRPREPRRLVAPLLTCTVLSIAYVAYCQAAWGTLTPPGASSVFRQAGYADAFIWFHPPDLLTPGEIIARWINPEAIWAATKKLNLYAPGWALAILVPAYLTAVVFLIRLVARGAARMPLAIVLTFGAGLPILALYTKPAYLHSAARGLTGFVPSILLLLIVAAEWKSHLGRVGRIGAPRRRRMAWPWAVVALSMLLFVPNHRKAIGAGTQLGEYQHLLQPAIHLGGTVLTNRPWEVAAATPLPAVVIPRDGPEATADVARRYRAEWLLVTRRFYDPELRVGLVYRESLTERAFSGLPEPRTNLSGLDLTLARETPIGRLYRIDAASAGSGSE